MKKLQKYLSLKCRDPHLTLHSFSAAFEFPSTSHINLAVCRISSQGDWSVNGFHLSAFCCVCTKLVCHYLKRVKEGNTCHIHHLTSDLRGRWTERWSVSQTHRVEHFSTLPLVSSPPFLLCFALSLSLLFTLWMMHGPLRRLGQTLKISRDLCW